MPILSTNFSITLTSKFSQFVSEPVSIQLPSLRDSPSTHAPKVSKPSYTGPIHGAPLYSHWFAMAVYDQFHAIKAAVLSNPDHITVDLCNDQQRIDSEKLDNVIEGFKQVSKMSSVPLYNVVGVMSSNELKGAEQTHTALYARALDRFLFDDESVGKGACLHQFPVKKEGNSVPKADLCVMALLNGLPGNPILLCDMKMAATAEALTLAADETACYATLSMCVKLVCDVPLFLGLAGTKSELQLLAFSVGDERKVRKITICNALLGIDSDLKAFFSVLFGAVHYLIQHPISMTTTTMVPIRDLDLSPLVPGREHPFVNEDEEPKVVYKLYDLGADPQDILPNDEIIRILDNDYLPNMSRQILTPITKRIHCLQYNYVDGNHDPTNVSQCAKIMNDLAKLHDNGYVHGDMRKSNLLFSADGTNAWIIDFDLAGKEGTYYPASYNHSHIDERHKDAKALRPRKKEHDRFALTCIFRSYSHLFENTHQLFVQLGKGTPLFDIANELTPNH